MNRIFERIARNAAVLAGRPVVFILAVSICLVWACFGPVYHWSDTHQLIINTGTTIVTFLLAFLIQNTQSRDTVALHAKLDELIRATSQAHNSLIDLEHDSDDRIAAVKQGLVDEKPV